MCCCVEFLHVFIYIVVKNEDYREYSAHTREAYVIPGNTAVFVCDIRPSFVMPYVTVVSWFVNDQQVING